MGYVTPRLLIKVGQAQWSWRELTQIHVTTSLENLFSILNTEGNTPCNPPLHSLYKPSPKRWGGGAGGPGLWGTSCPSSLLDALQTLHIPSPQPGLAPQFGSLTMGWESSPGSHVFSHLSNRWDRAHVIICQFVETLSSLPAPYTGEPWIAWVHLKVDFIQYIRNFLEIRNNLKKNSNHTA